LPLQLSQSGGRVETAKSTPMKMKSIILSTALMFGLATAARRGLRPRQSPRPAI
jgi:hypothetical protein